MSVAMNQSMGFHLNVLFVILVSLSSFVTENVGATSLSGSEESLFDDLINPKTALKDRSDAAFDLNPLSEQSEKSKAGGARLEHQPPMLLQRGSPSKVGLLLLKVPISELPAKYEQQVSKQDMGTAQELTDLYSVKTDHAHSRSKQVVGDKSNSHNSAEPTSRPPVDYDAASQEYLAGKQQIVVDKSGRIYFMDEDGVQHRVKCRLEPKDVAATSSARQLSLPANEPLGPVDFLSKLQRSIAERRNAIEDHVDQHLGISVPTQLVENKKGSTKIKGFDEGRKIPPGKVSNRNAKALQSKVNDMTARLNTVQFVFDIIKELMNFVTSLTGGSGSRAGLEDFLKEILSLVSSLNIFS